MQQRDQRTLVIAATSCAAVVLASQIVGKAARDAIFLRQFAVTNLPLLLALSSALAIGTTFLFARRLSRGLPMRVVQIANLGSAALLLVLWLLLPHFPRPMAVAIYIQQMLTGPILVSGFWSMISDTFDPRTARRVVATVGTGATIGGLLGALLAERVAALVGTNALLPTIACLQVIASWRLTKLGGATADAKAVEEPKLRSVIGQIARVSLLRRLAMITVLVTVAAALLDYSFKSVVRENVTRPDDLARAFAMFHGVVGLLTAIVAWTLGRRSLQRWGLAPTLAALPGAVILFGAGALVIPGLGAIVALRGAENVVRNSLYRGAYEVFYTPLTASERHETKTVIDVGVERLGDVIGGALLLVILALVTNSTPVLIGASIVLSVLGVVVALQAQRSYVQALERSLLASATEADTVAGTDSEEDAPADRTTLLTRAMVAKGERLSEVPALRAAWRFRRRRESPRGALDPTLARLGELTSGNAVRIRAVLASGLLSPAGVAHAVPLLARADVAVEVRRALSSVAASCVGQLVDAARDPQLVLAVRTQLPLLIAQSGGEQARTSLLTCLADPELEMRYHAAKALLALCEGDPLLAIDHEAVFAGVRRELALEAASWAALELAIAAEPVADEPPLSGAAQHLGSLLALALPADAVKAAMQGVSSSDPQLRGVSLEYLDNVLPADIREGVWSLLAIEVPVATAATTKRSLAEVEAALRQARATARAMRDGKPAAVAPHP